MKTKHLTITALFSVVLFISSYFTLPIGLVPVTTQTFFVILIGLLLPWQFALLATTTNLILQCLFQSAFLKPSFGFILGFIVASTLLSWLSYSKNAIIRQALSVISISLVLYIVGVAYFMVLFPHKPFWDILSILVLPFLIGDTVKALLALTVVKHLKKISISH